MDELVDLTITGPDAEWLVSFTRELVADGLAACGNIIPGVRSIYAWEGAIQDDAEALVILHTRKSLVAQIIDRTTQAHPYDTPQVLALAVVDAHPDYRSWVLATTETPTQPAEANATRP